YYRSPEHDGVYQKNIGVKVVWSAPFTQGYNNYDISYTNGKPVKLYTVTVNDSYAKTSGAGSYLPGIDVIIMPGIRIGYTFTGWTINEGNITLKPATIVSAALMFVDDAVFTMPENNVVVTVNWKNTTEILVGTENELREAVKNAISHTTIIFTADIPLTSTPLSITIGKNITLTSLEPLSYNLATIDEKIAIPIDRIQSGIIASPIDSTQPIMLPPNIRPHRWFKLIGENTVETITVETGGELELAGIIVTHKDNAAGGNGVIVQTNSKLSLLDGEIVGNTGSPDIEYIGYQVGGGVKNYGHFSMIGGTITDNTTNDWGGGVFNSGAFEMLGGTITGNTTKGCGGGVHNARNSKFTMSEGEISNNTANSGGGVYNQGIFTMENGIILHNTATSGGGGVHNDGNTYTNKFTMLGGKIFNNNVTYYGGGIYNNRSGHITIAGGESSYNKALRGGGIYNDSGNCSLSGGTISYNNATDSGGGIYHDFGKCDLAGISISNNSANANGGGIHNTGNGDFTIKDSIISNNTACYGGGMYTNGDFTMMMSKGAISNNTACYGGGIYNNYGSFTMSKGTISNNNASSSGGGIYNNRGCNINITIGTISYNTAIYGGGIHNTGTITLTNGTITNNKAEKGGGIINAHKSIFTMDNGEISYNTATVAGGVINNGEFTLSHGEINNNKATDTGGVYNNGTFTMHDGEISYNNDRGVQNWGNFTIYAGAISNNTTTGVGGGVLNFYGANFTMSGGTISYNTAKGNGGGIFSRQATINLSGKSEITNNTAAYGGGIANYWGKVTMTSDSEITNNTAKAGGGIFNLDNDDNKNEVFVMSGGKISGNTAYQIAGGIWHRGGVFTLEDGIISNNTANTSGGGIYLQSGIAKLKSGTISNNTVNGNGGGVGVIYENLNNLYVENAVVFSDNSASKAYYIDPQDLDLYNSHIGNQVTWTKPFTQGYNNYDIEYTKGPKIELYAVTVKDSYTKTSGAGNYLPDQNVNIDAGMRSDCTFTEWTINEGNIQLPNITPAVFIMPARKVVVTANWSDKPRIL
ncbi:MAG: hypothetical protein FWE73_07555, partial [Candidatus Bathyarchaeota archaeon]|nr:hypothetical protein [Candidatus Termitimicrobium sp.]MCL2686227.1 hypothetical protein [Candidatus Termitimicrobium sp.]